MMGTRTGAEDVAQEAFLSLWRSGARYDRARGSVRTWVLGIVHHRAIDALRRASVHDRRRADDEATAERFEAPERTDDEAARREEAATSVARSGRSRPTRCQVIELAYFGGFTHVEIADMLDTPVGTVKGRMRLGLKKMHEALAHGAVASEGDSAEVASVQEAGSSAPDLDTSTGPTPPARTCSARCPRTSARTSRPPRDVRGMPRRGRRAAAAPPRRCRCRRPPMLPPPALKARIMAEVEREAALLAPAGPAPTVPVARTPPVPLARCAVGGSRPWRGRRGS